MVARSVPAGHALLTYEEAGLLLGRSPATIRAAVSDGILPSLKLPKDRRRYIRREDLEYFRDKPFIKSLARPSQLPDTPVGSLQAEDASPPASEQEQLWLGTLATVGQGFAGIAANTSINLAATYRSLFEHLPPELSAELRGKLPELMTRAMAECLAVLTPLLSEIAEQGEVSSATLDLIGPALVEAVAKDGPVSPIQEAIAQQIGEMVKQQTREAGIPVAVDTAEKAEEDQRR